MHLRSLSGLAAVLVLASCSSLRSPIVPGAAPKDHGAIGATEGPAWHDGSLYFTDGKHINRMGPDGKTTVFRHNASNGLLFDREGRLIACETKNRRVTRTEKDGSITVLADRFEGKRFNSPNDLCMDSKGRIYFTDPRYGSRDGMEIEMPLSSIDLLLDPKSKPTSIEGVYRIDVPGKVTQVLSGGSDLFRLELPGGTTLSPAPVVLTGVFQLHRPNGILISPDGRYLYIADNNNNNHGGSRKLLRYTLDKNGDVKPGTRKVLFDWKDGRGPDGMKMDAAGRIYVAAGTNQPTEYETTRFKAGCYILSPSGKLLDFIPVAPDECCNCAFGGKDGKTLFITSGSHLWSLPLK
ncbi:MAG: SMP-30/gluconolactonase/LRE family protein [Verrucomicrobiaceae bacterium]